MRRAAAVSVVIGLSIFLAVAARSADGLDPDDDPEGEAAREAILRNDWIEKLPYVTDVQPGRVVCGKGPNAVTSAHYTIVVETDNEDHVTLLEKKVPASLEGFPVIVLVDRYPQWELEGEQMRAKVQPVVDDPANKWILKIPHVVRMLPATTNTDEGEPTSPAVGIAVDSGKRIKEVQSKVPKTIGGFPTTYGWVEGIGECFTTTGEGCENSGIGDNDDD